MNPFLNAPTLYIDGKWLEGESGSTFPVTDPATGASLGQASVGSRADAGAAVEAADRAFPSWAALTAYERAAVLDAAYRLMLERAEELAQLMTAEQGKPLKMARNEVRYAADFLSWYAEEAKRVYGSTVPSSRADQRFLVLRQPVGVVAAVTPWNYPISMITRKVAPALAAGCTVVFKPAEQTPLCAKAVIDIFDELELPPGVLNMVTTNDPADVVDVFLDSPVVRKVTFTGSTEVGKLLYGKSAATVKRVSLELGGHAPFVVLPGANAKRAAVGASLVKFLNTGQACISPNRLYVHRSAHDEFVDELVRRVSALKVGPGVEDGVSVGPLIDEAAMAKMQRQVADATGKGAAVLTGGSRLVDGELRNGQFFAPTILDGVTTEMDISREETFGPIAPVIVYDDPEEVLDLANDTTYGLAAYVYTENLGEALRFAEGLQFGIVGINDINPTAASAPFGGVKESGLGREGGPNGIDEYLDTKLIGITV